MKKTIFLFLFYILCVGESQARQGITYEMNKGTGYIYQGDLWQTAITLNYSSKPNWSYGKDRVYGKILFARQIAQFHETAITVGASISQLREVNSSEYANTTIGFPVGLRFPLTENIQADVRLDTIQIVSERAYDSITSTYYGNIEGSGRNYLSSGSVNLSMFF